MALWSNVASGTKDAIERGDTTLAENMAAKYLPPGVRSNAQAALAGSDSGLNLAERAALQELVRRNDTQSIQSLYLSTESPLLGGMTPTQVIEMMDNRSRLARGNLFLVSVSPLVGSADDVSLTFNLMATEFSYAPLTIAGDYQKAGGALIDLPSGAEAVQLNLTTYDDEMGTLKKWFANMTARTVQQDGTFGVPASYGVRIKVTHAFAGNPPDEAYTDNGIYRVANMEVTGARSESGPATVQFTFAQIDTFWGV